MSRLGVPCLYSTSIKIQNPTTSRDRWLLTLPETATAPKAITQTLALAGEFLGHPVDALHLAVPTPVAVHFGQDGIGRDAIRKAYFECPDPPPAPMFIALKAGAKGCERHHYRPCVALEELPYLQLPPNLQDHVCAFLNSLPGDIAALKVTSTASTRISLDMNLCDVALQTAHQDHIAALIAEIDPSYPRLGMAAQGISHIAVGMTADGTAFLTLYGPPTWLSPESSG
jgi:hypothetical protein